MIQKNIYEIGLLINPDLSQQEAEKTIDDLKNILEKQSASVISEGEVVDIDLAYQIVTKIASKNIAFNKGYFSWIKFEINGSSINLIKKDIDKINSKIFRYLITKTVSDNEATDKYNKPLISDLNIDKLKELEDKDSKKKEGDVIDTTSEDFNEFIKEEEVLEKKKVKKNKISEEKKVKKSIFSKILGKK